MGLSDVNDACDPVDCRHRGCARADIDILCLYPAALCLGAHSNALGWVMNTQTKSKLEDVKAGDTVIYHYGFDNKATLVVDRITKTQIVAVGNQKFERKSGRIINDRSRRSRRSSIFDNRRIQAASKEEVDAVMRENQIKKMRLSLDAIDWFDKQSISDEDVLAVADMCKKFI
jgi:hypothetical protein